MNGAWRFVRKASRAVKRLAPAARMACILPLVLAVQHAPSPAGHSSPAVRRAGDRWRVTASSHATIDSSTEMSLAKGDKTIQDPPHRVHLDIQRGLAYVEEVLEARPGKVTSIRRHYEEASRVQEIRPLESEATGTEVHRDDRPPSLRGAVVDLAVSGPNLVHVDVVSGSPDPRELSPLRYGCPEEPWRDLVFLEDEDVVLAMPAARRVLGIDRIVALVLAQHLGPGEVDRLFTTSGKPGPIRVHGEVRAGAPSPGRRVARGHLTASLSLIPENQPQGSRWTAKVVISSFEGTLVWDGATGQPRSWSAIIDLRVEVRAQEAGGEGMTRFLRTDTGRTELTRNYSPAPANPVEGGT